jgi:hypothetical protein
MRPIVLDQDADFIIMIVGCLWSSGRITVHLAIEKLASRPRPSLKGLSHYPVIIALEPRPLPGRRRLALARLQQEIKVHVTRKYATKIG